MKYMALTPIKDDDEIILGKRVVIMEDNEHTRI